MISAHLLAKTTATILKLLYNSGSTWVTSATLIPFQEQSQTGTAFLVSGGQVTARYKVSITISATVYLNVNGGCKLQIRVNGKIVQTVTFNSADHWGNGTISYTGTLEKDAVLGVWVVPSGSQTGYGGSTATINATKL